MTSSWVLLSTSCWWIPSLNPSFMGNSWECYWWECPSTDGVLPLTPASGWHLMAWSCQYRSKYFYNNAIRYPCFLGFFSFVEVNISDFRRYSWWHHPSLSPPSPNWVEIGYTGFTLYISPSVDRKAFEILANSKICNFDFVFFSLGIQYDSIIWVIMRQQGGILRPQAF